MKLYDRIVDLALLWRRTAEIPNFVNGILPEHETYPDSVVEEIDGKSFRII